MTLAAIIISGIYLVAGIILASAIRIRRARFDDKSSVSLIITAKDEERDLPRALNSLLALDYPPDKLEIILVDHRSQDGTLNLMRVFQKQSPFPVKIVEIKEKTSHHPGKAEALNAGTAEASGEILVFIDAECRFEQDWLRSILGGLETGSDCLGGGFLVEGETVFAKLQRLDALYLSAVGNSLTEIGHPQSLFGKNLAVRRDLYQQAGGFPKDKAWTEDLELVKRSAELGKVRMSLAKENFVYSVPESEISAFFRQRLRWLKGGLNVGLWGLSALILEAIINLAFLIYLFVDFKLALLIFIVKVLADYAILQKLLRELDLKRAWELIPIYSLFSIIYHLALLAILPFKKDLKWR
jgi:cellulose synthase/poly-beta-1,6-N-acetylglucosamine synthase-like glycosyltransferase